MDPVSQAALGGAWAQSATSASRVRLAMTIGAVAGMAPDLDVLIRSAGNPWLALEFHRHFTHSLAFIPIGALLCSLLVYPFVRTQCSKLFCYLASLLGYASHGLLDACTSYGTQLLWPFSDRRIAWDLVSVIDPLVTGPLILIVLIAALRRRPRLALIGVAWCLCYFGLSVVQQQRVEVAILALALERGHVAERIDIKPSFANILVWRTLYRAEGEIHIDAVRAGLRTDVVAGETFAGLVPARDLPWLGQDTQQWEDLQFFDWFADGWLAMDKTDRGLILDLRYALVPNSGGAFWGMQLDDSATPDKHAAYVTMRNRSVEEGRELLGLVFGWGLD